ncbi:MAG: tRNA (N6-threonylcarbamoyladenosine(37)-N6)-methyltransferase TrmO [Thermoplasmata archaeon]
MVIEPIGHVRNDVGGGKVDSWRGIESKVVLKEQFEPLLDGIEDFSHVVVIGWLHEIEGYAPSVHPRGRKDLPEVGVFATRTPHRPNPIGVTVVNLLSRDGTTLKVSDLDFYNGTPVLDIKPFTPKYLGITDLRIPEWMRTLYGDKDP